MKTRPQKAYIIRGLPGSGKTTVARKTEGPEGGSVKNVHLENDMFFTSRGVYKFDRRRIKQAVEWCRGEFVKALRAGNTPIVANTFTQKKEIDPYVKAAREAGVRLIIITCTGQYGSIHKVPMSVMAKLAKRNLTAQEVADLYPDAIHFVEHEGEIIQLSPSTEV